MKEISLYIHIPFCKQKCLYCDFHSYACKEDYMDDYIKALCLELLKYRDRKFKTIFIGGGTPTYLTYDNLKMLLSSIQKLNVSSDVEFTIEGNPGTFTEEKLKLLKSMGVNRLSIGFQAWQDELLKGLGRIHNRQDFLESYATAKRIGFENINIDLMFGLPNQTLNDWKETLYNVIDLNPQHLSCYSLIVEEGTPFYELYRNGKLNIPEEEMEREMYNTTLDILKNNGYNQYEISNFSKENLECKHNLVYWELGEYIGCGVSAHSYIDGYRIENIDSIEEYIKNINAEEEIILSQHENSIKENIEEFMFMGLRKIKGISRKEFKKRYHNDIENIYGSQIEKFTRNNLITRENDNYKLSKEGIEVSNYVLSEFILDS